MLWEAPPIFGFRRGGCWRGLSAQLWVNPTQPPAKNYPTGVFFRVQEPRPLFAAEAVTRLLGGVDCVLLQIAGKLVIPMGNFSTPFGSYHDVHLMPAGTVPFDTYVPGCLWPLPSNSF